MLPALSPGWSTPFTSSAAVTLQIASSFSRFVRSSVKRAFLLRLRRDQRSGPGGVETVGVTAGASTPDWLIEKVVGHLNNIPI
jgi:4-hydroxy-3-methylbut-2-enyl diphosphate reductase IspH